MIFFFAVANADPVPSKPNCDIVIKRIQLNGFSSGDIKEWNGDGKWCDSLEKGYIMHAELKIAMKCDGKLCVVSRKILLKLVNEI